MCIHAHIVVCVGPVGLFKAVVNSTWSLVPTGELIIKLSDRYNECLLNVLCLGVIHTFKKKE